MNNNLDIYNMTYEQLSEFSKKTGYPLYSLIITTLKADYIIKFFEEHPQSKVKIQIMENHVIKSRNPKLIAEIAKAQIPGVNINRLAEAILHCEDSEEKLLALYLFSGTIPNGFQILIAQEREALQAKLNEKNNSVLVKR